MSLGEPKRRKMKVSDAEAQTLRVPSFSLPRYAHLVDLETSNTVRFDQDAITRKLQQTEVGYFSDPSLIDGSDYTYWLTVIKSRQTGSTNTCALCVYPLVSYTPGSTAAVAADTRDRANEIFRRINFAYNRWDPAVRTDRESSNETRTLTTTIDSTIKVLSMETPDAAIGSSFDWFVGSECPLWADAEHQMSALIPTMINRKASKMVLESTPQPLSAPSGQWWFDQWQIAVSGTGRWRAAFFPFWDSKANNRPWPKGTAPTNDELRLLERFGGIDRAGHPGLTLENLAFRREVMETDSAVRRNPELFSVFYPFDDATCWISQGLGIIPSHAVDRHLRRQLYQESGDYNEFPDSWSRPSSPVYPVNPNAVYVIGVDPAGYGRDHHAFQVLEVWDDEWIQVASYGAICDPNEFAQFLFDTGIHFNKAKIAIERTGVGHGPAMLLKHMKYPNLYYDDKGKPGLHKSSQEEWLEKLVDSLMDKLVLRGKQTALQVKGYRHDKMTEQTQKAALIRGTEAPGPGRRERGHWDKVSALMVACAVAPKLPRRYKPVDEPDNVIPFDRLTINQQIEYLKAVERKKEPRRRQFHYSRRRRH